MHRRSFLTRGTAAALGTTLPSCIPQSYQPPLQVGTSIWIGNDFLYLAERLGYWDSRTIERLDYSTNAEIARAYRNQKIQVAAVTLMEAIELMETHPGTRVFLIVDFSHGNDVILSRPSISSLKALKGRKVGLEPYAFQYYMLIRGLQTVGLKLHDVDLVHLGSEEQEAALKQGLIDGLVAYDPIRTAALKGGARVLFNSRQMPGEIADVLVTNTDTIQKHSAALQTLVKGWFNAIAAVQRDPINAVQPMAEREGMTPAEFRTALELIRLPDRAESKSLLSIQNPALHRSTQHLQQFMLERKLLKQPVNLQQLLTAQFVH